eukprot:CAMPEP_0197655336 /NCGR_PEP_ID=MMETSP1338-20131121/39392_1 /TAXON_ID=43686 ORGANISM="Pelagodinium beii, Strain RCC1491" /NCGR_SAMPLE_ID=MMETSP1338 /ASSEMBLY_ACC=CAM_ASM_000754 /LENGTH=501 /DNA_ID=CAMNT_0043230963 /DNA_START=25 /DNA_END=1530 /DNA_ORIENTATION=+
MAVMKLWAAGLLVLLSWAAARKLSSSKDPNDDQAGLEVADDVELSDAAQLEVEQLASVTLKPQEDSLLPSIPTFSTDAPSSVAAVAMSSRASDYRKKREDLTSLEAEILALSKKGKPTNETIAFVQSVEEILDAMVEELSQQNTHLIERWATECRDGFDRCQLATGFWCTPQNYNISGYALGHRQCRREQWLIWLRYLELLKELAFREQNRDYWCLMWDLNETDSQWPYDTPNACLYPSEKYKIFGDKRYWMFFQDQFKFWDSYWASIVTVREKCQEHEWWYKYTFNRTNEVFNSYLSKKDECDAAQDVLNNASCEFNGCMTDGCTGQIYTCYQAVIGHCATLVDVIQYEVDDNHDLLRIIKRIRCLIRALLEADVGKAIQVCVETSYDTVSPATTTTGTFSTTTTTTACKPCPFCYPGRECPCSPCPLPPVNPVCRNCTVEGGWRHECVETDEYKMKYYAGCYNLNITCRQKCCNNTAAPQAVVQPPVFSKLAFDGDADF